MLLCFSYHQSNLQLIYHHIASSLEKLHLIFNALFTLKCHSKWLCEWTLLIPLLQGPKWHIMLSGCSCFLVHVRWPYSPVWMHFFACCVNFALHHACFPLSSHLSSGLSSFPVYWTAQQHIVRYYLACMCIYIQINISVYFFSFTLLTYKFLTLTCLSCATLFSCFLFPLGHSSALSQLCPLFLPLLFCLPVSQVLPVAEIGPLSCLLLIIYPCVSSSYR